MGHMLFWEGFMMKYCLITFRSVTPAQRAEAVLRRIGVECNIQRTPKWMEEQGCGYSLRLQAAQLPLVLEMLRREEVPFKKVYRQKDKSWMEDSWA